MDKGYIRQHFLERGNYLFNGITVLSPNYCGEASPFQNSTLILEAQGCSRLTDANA